MYAVIATGGKQYRVQPGQSITVEKLDGAVGEAVELPCVMVVDDSGEVTAGAALNGRTATATITDSTLTQTAASHRERCVSAVIGEGGTGRVSDCSVGVRVDSRTCPF